MVRALKPMPAQRRDGADGQAIVGADDRAERLPPHQQFLRATLAFGLVERGREHGVRLRLADAEELAMQLEGAIAPVAGRERLRPGNRRDLAVSARDEMREDAADAVLLIVNHRRNAPVVT